MCMIHNIAFLLVVLIVTALPSTVRSLPIVRVSGTGIRRSCYYPSVRRLSARKRKDLEDLVDITSIETQVLASAQAKLDANRLLQALDQTDDEDASSALSTLVLAQPWKIALAASLLCSTAVFFTVHNLLLTALVSVLVFVTANSDPLDDHSLAGALARMLGRVTIQSVQASQPKVKALARAVVTGDEELVELKKRIQQLEQENTELQLWKSQRLKVEDGLSYYSLTSLKDRARQHNLSVAGTKIQLLMRLVEAGAIEL